MTKSATDVMQDIIFAAVVDGVAAMKASSKGVPNTLLRDIGSLHPNTTFSDLAPELQAAITSSVRAAFTRLQKEGYSVTNGEAPPPRSGPPRRPTREPNAGGPGPRGDRRDSPPRPRSGQRPNRTPKPRGS